MYIDHAGYSLEKEGGSLVVRDQEGSLLQRIPLAPLHRLILQGDIHLHTGLLLALLAQGTAVVCFSGRQSDAVVQCLGKDHNDATRRLAQYALLQDPERKLRLARLLLQRKLHTQGRALRFWLRQEHGKRQSLLHALREWKGTFPAIATASMEQLLGIEGQAAALYFPAFFSTLPKAFQAETRQRRPPRDPANALLSLAYTLLHQEAVHVAYAQGLDPYLGVFHTPSFGRESLACDLVEPFRSLIDEWIRDMLHQAILREEHFYSDRGAILLDKAGRKAFYQEWIAFVPGLRKRLRRMGRLAVRSLEWA